MIFKVFAVVAFIAAIAAGLLYFLNAQGLPFCMGGIFAIIVYQFGYYARHGEWIEF